MEEKSIFDKISSCNELHALRSVMLEVQATGDGKLIKRRDHLGLTVGHHLAVRLSDLHRGG